VVADGAGTLPATMRAAVYRRRGLLEVTRIPLPALGPRDALVRVSHCGICGTDLHLVVEGWGQEGSIGGHEYAGRIAAVGLAVTGWRAGELVVGRPGRACGACEACRAGRPSLCEQRPSPLEAEAGAFAEYVRVCADRLVRIPRGLSPREAALAEPLAVALHGIGRAQLAADPRVLVTGAGPIGALVVAALRARGVERVVVSEPASSRRALALRVGAAQALEPGALATPPLPFEEVAEPFDAVFECSGRRAATELGLAQLRRGGCLVLLGTGMERPRLDANRVLINELVVTGAYNYDAGGFEEALTLLAERRLPVRDLVHPEDASLETMGGVMTRLAEGTIAGKVMVRPAEEDLD
jgi:threonine dehydrogenase-like Zn-dependent dehydrogenase